MIKQAILALCLIMAAATVSHAAVIDGVDLPDSLKIGSEKLLLNGAGMRIKTLGPINKDVYVAGLYLKEKCCDSSKIINADETMVLRIKIVTCMVTSDRFADHTLNGFKESTHGNIAPIQKEINEFLSVFAEEINDGDLFEIVYQKDVGIQVFKNGGKDPKTTITGLPLKSALFGIWLGQRSDKNLQVLANKLLSAPAS